MIDLQNSGNEEDTAILGVWEEQWRARAQLADQAERYRAWLRVQGCTRDQAADMAVRLLMSREPDVSQPDTPNASLVH
jgi:hypothetical protein